MIELSVVITVLNEEENVKMMIERLTKALIGLSYEVIFVNDGSTDRTEELVKEFATPQIRIVSFTRNFGQSIAMRAGIDAAQGRYIAFMDGDLQNDPDDLPNMLSQLKDENWDVVMGYRKQRKDNKLLRNFPSMVANAMIRKVTGIKLRDGGCSLRVFKREFAQGLDLYGELHRFIPVLTIMQGARVKQVDVQHHERLYGVSKYGLSRIFKVIPDLLFIYFLKNYSLKPMHFFGAWAMGFAVIGKLLIFCAIISSLIDIHFPLSLTIIGAISISMAMIAVAIGLISEIQMRIYHSSEKNPVYRLKNLND
ncbi:MAG: glycosyltransferase family 2 protein [Bacteroidales bacterium]